MKKSAAPVEIEIDQNYEAQVDKLQAVTGSINDYTIEPARPQHPAPPPTWVPEDRPRPAATAYPVGAEQVIEINPASNIQQTVEYVVTPGSRADALIKRLIAWSIPLALLTGFVMYVFTLYPPTLATLAIFTLWMAVALTETLIVFLVLSILDYRETPAAQNRNAMNKTMRLMAIEQGVRLIGLYGEETYDRAVKTIRRAGF